MSYMEMSEMIYDNYGQNFLNVDIWMIKILRFISTDNSILTFKTRFRRTSQGHLNKKPFSDRYR